MRIVAAASTITAQERVIMRYQNQVHIIIIIMITGQPRQSIHSINVYAAAFSAEADRVTTGALSR